MIDQIISWLNNFIAGVSTLHSSTIVAVILVSISIIILDASLTGAARKREGAGVSKKAVTVSIDGSKTLPIRNYISDIQGLAGRPDALISEQGYIIPIERKPLARKLRDRYVAQLLVYMRLVEEFEGKRPPYGYLILGPNCRTFKIDNTPKRQQWLQEMLDAMRQTLNSGECTATPDRRKCSGCFVKEHCAFRADLVSEVRKSQNGAE